MKSKIREGLYLGSYHDAVEVVIGADHGITHLLSVTDADVPPPAAEASLKTKAIPLVDDEFANLLDIVEECIGFIEEALQQDGAAVLVHCNGGVSRSAAVVVAYLMWKEHRAVDTATGQVQKLRQNVYPNEGFLRQLGMFERMGYKVDKSTVEYKLFRAKELREACEWGSPIPLLRFAAFVEEDGIAEEELMRCHACKRVVASASNLVHREHSGPLFVEPLQWMIGQITDLNCNEGDLSCVGCGALLGTFSWEGTLCKCGLKLIPAFQLNGCTAMNNIGTV